jgi:peptide/nickel transport system ATP-binding protein/oligopeptide transport system ATP-binding protein
VPAPILHLEEVVAEYVTPEGVIRPVNAVSLELNRGQTLALTGESGSGKTSVALSILNLLPHPGRITGGRIEFHGVNLLGLSSEELRRIRGREIAMVCQDPANGLNPVLTVGQQVEEAITTHLDLTKREARDRVIQVLSQAGLPDPATIVGRYPFQLSGGMAQRVMIAIAVALDPKVLILDEPTSAVDVTVQAAILEDLRRMQRERGTSILLITHDLGVVAQMADDVAVMYAGSIVEHSPAQILFDRPLHPYTWSLLGSRPRWDREGAGRLTAIRGNPPNLSELGEQCPFLGRCPKATSECRIKPAPALSLMEPGHAAACFNPVFHASREVPTL